MIRVVLADDQAVVRAGFRTILESEGDIAVVGEASDGAHAVRTAQRERPDVVVMDVRMPEVDGIVATEQLAGRDVADPITVLVVTTFDLDEYVFGALAAGASGFLLKDMEPEALIDAVRLVAGGHGLVAPEVTRSLIEEFTRRHAPAIDPAALDDLTPREVDVLQLLATGCTNAEIAAQLVIESTTVKTHVGRILEKVGARDRVQAVIWAYERGVVVPGRT